MTVPTFPALSSTANVGLLGPLVNVPPAHEVEEVIEPLEPWQIVTPVVTGGVLTVTVTFAVFVQPKPFVPVTVYVWVEVGLATTVGIVVEDNPVAGLQV